MTEGERERAHDAEPIREVDHCGRLLGDRRRARRLEGQDLDPLLRPLPVEQVAVQVRTPAAFRRPLLLRAEVVDEAELDVGHRRTVRDGDREREETDPALCVQRAVDRIDDDARPSAGTDLHLAALLRDEHAVDRRRLEAPDDRRLGRSVDRRRLVAARTGAHDRLAVGACG
jgi:hypothetical protein